MVGHFELKVFNSEMDRDSTRIILMGLDRDDRIDFQLPSAIAAMTAHLCVVPFILLFLL